jgi:hypothetical protein
MGHRYPLQGQVAEEDEQIRLGNDELFTDGGERDRVAVDVGDDGDPAGSVARHARRLASSPSRDHLFVLRRKAIIGLLIPSGP